MPIALTTAGLPSQPRQGVGARLVRRLGGAVRSVIGSGIDLAAALRRPAVPETSRDHAAAQAPAPTRVRVPRSRHAAVSAPLRLPHWLARLLLARRHHRPAAGGHPAFRNLGDKRFTPQGFPQFSPKACAILNTPLEDCDPETLELVFSTFAQHIGELMSPEAGITDPQAILSNLWRRTGTALGIPNADTCLSTTLRAVSVTAADPAPPTPPIRHWTNHAPKNCPDSPSPCGRGLRGGGRGLGRSVAPLPHAGPRDGLQCLLPPPPLAGRPRGITQAIRTGSGAYQKAMNGATARLSRLPNSGQASTGSHRAWERENGTTIHININMHGPDESDRVARLNISPRQMAAGREHMRANHLKEFVHNH